MSGIELLRFLIEATGLPSESVERELTRVIQAQGLTPEALTLDNVREVLATYLQETLVEAKENF